MNDEQRREAGCPARQAGLTQQGQATSMRVIFFGTPEFAVPSLTALFALA